MNHRMNQYFVVQKFKNFGTYSGTNYASYRIIGIEIIRFRCKVHLMVRRQRNVVLWTTTGQIKSENPIGQWTHVIIMKCKSSSLIAPQLWSWYPYQKSTHFIFLICSLRRRHIKNYIIYVSMGHFNTYKVEFVFTIWKAWVGVLLCSKLIQVINKTFFIIVPYFKQ